MLLHSGAGAVEVFDVLQRSIANVERHGLPAIYRQNAHVLNEGMSSRIGWSDKEGAWWQRWHPAGMRVIFDPLKEL